MILKNDLLPEEIILTGWKGTNYAFKVATQRGKCE
jgi:hypothetical protein